MTAPTSSSGSPAGPWPALLAVTAGVATFSAMDAAIKAAALMVGVYTALLLRNAIGTAMVLPVWLSARPTWPSVGVLGLHALRSTVNCVMALLFFIALVRIPMAEAMALSFISPLIALYLAAILLGETIRRRAIVASLLGLAGVTVIVADRLGSGSGSGLGGGRANTDALIGVAAVLASAVLYAINLVLQRKQATLAGPAEITLFQNLIVAAILALSAPWFAVMPAPGTLGLIALGALLATVALSLLAWGYARAEAQVLVPIEYTGFIWAALLGWFCFGEPVGAATLAGVVLIVLGCWIGTRADNAALAEQAFV